MTQEEWHQLKASVADGFAALHYADSMSLTETEKNNLCFCLTALNGLLDEIPA